MNRNVKYQLLMVLAMTIWGGAWVCGKAVSHDLHFQKLALIRFFLTFLFFIPPVFVLRQNLRIDRETVKKIVIGSLLYTTYSQMFFLGLTRGSAGHGGILVTTLVPIFTFAATSFSSRARIRLIESAGLVMGFAGALVILKIWSVDAERLLLSGNLFFLIGAALWSGVTINSHGAQERASIWVYSLYLNGFSALWQLLFAAPHGLGDLFSADVTFWAHMLYLSLLSTVFATSLYFHAAKILSPHRASAFTFLVPLSAVMLSWIFLRETPEASTLVGGCLSIAAVYLIQYARVPAAEASALSDYSGEA